MRLALTVKIEPAEHPTANIQPLLNDLDSPHCLG